MPAAGPLLAAAESACVFANAAAAAFRTLVSSLSEGEGRGYGGVGLAEGLNGPILQAGAGRRISRLPTLPLLSGLGSCVGKGWEKRRPG